MSYLSRQVIWLTVVLLFLTGRGFAATAIGSITVTGAERSSGSTWDTGTVTAKINGVSVSFAYGQFSNSAAIASALGALISQNCNMPVYAKANGATLTFYKKGSNVIQSASIISTSNIPSLFPSSSFLMNGGSFWSPPEITNLSLSQGPPSMGLVITGTGFTADVQVTIGGLTATIIGVPTSTQITVQVPDGATSAGVVVWVDGYPSSPWMFDVLPPFVCS